MQNASNEKRKVSTNYLSGNHRLSVRVHATATPVQAVHVRTERTIVNEPAKRRCVSPAPREFARNWDTRRLWLSTAFRFSCKNTCRGDMYFVVSAVVLCSWKWSCFRGAGETHRRFAGSFTIVLSACTLTDSLYKSSELSTGRNHLQASIRSCTKDIFPSSGLWQRREKHETGCPLLAAKMASRDQCFASRSVAKMLSHDQRLKPTAPEASRKKVLVHGRLRWIVGNVCLREWISLRSDKERAHYHLSQAALSASFLHAFLQSLWVNHSSLVCFNIFHRDFSCRTSEKKMGTHNHVDFGQPSCKFPRFSKGARPESTQGTILSHFLHWRHLMQTWRWRIPSSLRIEQRTVIFSCFWV